MSELYKYCKWFFKKKKKSVFSYALIPYDEAAKNIIKSWFFISFWQRVTKMKKKKWEINIWFQNKEQTVLI